MGKKEVGIDNAVAIAGVTIIPVVEVSLNHLHGNGGFSFFGIKQPVSVVVVSPLGERAFRTTGEEVPLDQLIEEVPSIKHMLEHV